MASVYTYKQLFSFVKLIEKVPLQAER